MIIGFYYLLRVDKACGYCYDITSRGLCRAFRCMCACCVTEEAGSKEGEKDKEASEQEGEEAEYNGLFAMNTPTM